MRKFIFWRAKGRFGNQLIQLLNIYSGCQKSDRLHIFRVSEPFFDGKNDVLAPVYFKNNTVIDGIFLRYIFYFIYTFFRFFNRRTEMDFYHEF